MTYFFFFFNDTATTEIYPLSLHDALPICAPEMESEGATVTSCRGTPSLAFAWTTSATLNRKGDSRRSEEHTSELQSRSDLVCRLLLEKKKNTTDTEPNFLLHHALTLIV